MLRRVEARLLNRVERRAYGTPRWTRVVSTALVARQREAHHGLPSGFFRVRPLGVDERRFDPDAPHANARTPLGISADAFVVVTVARLVPWKNIDFLMRAIAMTSTGITLVVVGDGPDGPRLRAVANELGIAPRTQESREPGVRVMATDLAACLPGTTPGAAPRFTVVVIAYNQAQYIREALLSVLAARGTSLEVVCVDDGSTDGTADIVSELARGDARLRCVPQSHSGRPAVARNTGLGVATGEYICFLDGDDLYAPRKLALLDAAIVTASGPDVLFHDYVDFLDGSSPEAGQRRITGSAIEARLRSLTITIHDLPSGVTAATLPSAALAALLVADSFVINTDTVCIRRQLIVDLRLAFPHDRTAGEDLRFWLACVLGARNVCYVDADLAYWRKRAGSITRAPTSTTHGELVRSMYEQLAMVRHLLAPEQVARYRRKILDEAQEVGWLLEQEGAWPRAIATYVRAAIALRRPGPLLRAAKAAVRPLASRVHRARVADGRQSGRLP